MTKFTLDIDIDDRAACELGIQKLWTALVDHHGQCEAHSLWRAKNDLNEERRRAFMDEQAKFRTAIQVLSRERQRLILQYFAMPKPSKRGLAKMLAAGEYPRAYPLPGWATVAAPVSEDSVLRQINRVFSDHPQLCRVIGAAQPAIRQEALYYAEFACFMNEEIQAGLLKETTVTKKRISVTG